MSLWKKIKDKAVLDRLADEAFHAAAIDELSTGKRRDGLWAKAVLQSNGSETQAKIAYLRLLVSALKDESYISSRISEAHRPDASPHSPSTESPQVFQEPELESPTTSDAALIGLIILVVITFLLVVGVTQLGHA